MATPLEQYLDENPELRALPRDALLRQLHQTQFADMPYGEFVARASAPAQTVGSGDPSIVRDVQGFDEPTEAEAKKRAAEFLADTPEQTFTRLQQESADYSSEQRAAEEEARRTREMQQPRFVDPNTGLSPDDVDPATVDRFARGAARSFLSGSAHVLRALDRPGEAILGPDTAEYGPRGVAKKFEGLVAPNPPAETLGQTVTDIAGGVAGGIGPGIAQWVGGVPTAALSGLETAKEVAAEHGKDASTWESWRDAGVEGLARLALGRAATMPWGRITSGLTFGSISGGEALAEGRSGPEVGIGAITNFLMGVLGKNITPGAQARIDAAKAAAEAGNGAGAMHHLDELMKDPSTAAAVAKAARIRGALYPDASGDSVDKAASLPPPKEDVNELIPVGPGTGGAVRARAKDTIATVITQRDRANAFARQISDEGEPLFAGVPDQARIEMITSMMVKGRDIPQPYRDWFKRASEHQENQFLAETLGAELDYEYRQNYWHLQWKDPDAALRASVLLHGSGVSFAKGKVFDNPSEGLAYGLELKSTNPAVLWSWRQEAGNQAIARIMAMKDLVTDGLAVTQKTANEMSKGEFRERLPQSLNGYVPMDVGGTRYLIHPEAKKMMEWSLDYGRNGLAGILDVDPHGAAARAAEKAYRAWMLVKNATIPLKLSLSAFHALHILGIDSAQPYSSALNRPLSEHLTFAEFRKILADRGHLDRYAYGKKSAANWPRPYSDLSPLEQVDQSLMIAGGFTPGLPSVYEIGAERALRRTWNDVIPSLEQKLADPSTVNKLATAWRVPVEYAKAGAMLIGRGIEALQHPMFADWIPSIKTAAYLNQAKLLLATRPDLVGQGERSAAALRHELQMIRRSIDNRFGEMQYDKEFIRPILRRAAMAGMLSVGWNYGFFREFGGGFLKDLPLSAYRAARNSLSDSKVQNEITTRTIYAGIYTAQALMLGGLITFLMTGERPQSFKDLVYPRLPDNTRVTTMMFTRELGALYYHWLEQGAGRGALSFAQSKLAPSFQAFIEALTNSDYFEREVRDPNADIFTQVAQGMRYFAEQTASPISVSSALRNPEGDPAKTALSFGGFSPAPKYVETPRTLARIMNSYQTYQGHPTAFSDVAQRKDASDLKKVFEIWQGSGRDEDRATYEKAKAEFLAKYPEVAKSKQTMPQRERAWSKPQGLKMFSDLPIEEQKRIFAAATPGEQSWLQFGLRKTLRDRIHEFAPQALGRKPTPEELSQLQPDDQEAFLKALKWDERDEYLAFVDPHVRELMWSFEPAPPRKQVGSHHKKRGANQ